MPSIIHRTTGMNSNMTHQPGRLIALHILTRMTIITIAQAIENSAVSHCPMPVVLPPPMKKTHRINAQYQGILAMLVIRKRLASGAELVFIKIGDNTTGSASDAAMCGALRDAVDRYGANIISMRFGGWSPHHDGTDANCQAADYAVSKGATVFISAGNEADKAKHYKGTVAAGGATDYIRVNVTDSDGTNCTLLHNLVWYDGLGVYNELTLQYYDSLHDKIDTQGSARQESTRGTEQRYYSWGYPFKFVPSVNRTYYVKISNASTNSQDFHLYFQGTATGDGAVRFASPDIYYTLGSPGEADSVICVGSFNSRRSWTDYTGATQDFGETLGEVSSFSSGLPDNTPDNSWGYGLIDLQKTKNKVPQSANVQSSTGQGQVTFSTNTGTIGRLRATGAGSAPQGSGLHTFPYGLFSYFIFELSIGETIQVTVTLPAAGHTQWVKSTLNGWQQVPVISVNGNIMVIQLTDGGIGDDDNTAEGDIEDPGGPVVISSAISTRLPSSSASMSVTPPAPPVILPNVTVQGARLSTTTVTPGSPVTVTADVINRSTVNGNKKVTLYVNGQVETTQGVTVNSGGSSQLTFSVSRSEPGTYRVYVDSVPAGSFKVELFRESDIVLIFSITVLAMAFVVGLIMLWRRQRDYY